MDAILHEMQIAFITRKNERHGKLQKREAMLSYEGGASPASLSNPDTSRSYRASGEGGRDG